MDNTNWIYNRGNSFNNVPHSFGVYLIIVRMADGRKIVIYAGQSDDLQRRLGEHWSPSEPNKKLRNIIKNYSWSIDVYYCEVDGRSADGYEKFLRDKFEPQAQDKAPQCESKEIETPSDVSKGRISEKYFE